MKMEKNTIDQLFKEKLGNFEKNPPVGLLEHLITDLLALK